MQDQELKNEFLCIRKIDDNMPRIRGLDLTDTNNEPSFYTKSIRGLDKAWIAISNSFNNNTKISNILDILDEHNIKYHTYCAVD